MKRAGLSILLAVLVMVAAGCSRGSGKTDEAEFLKSLEEANTFDALVASEGVFRSVSAYTSADGSTEDYIIYGDKDLHIITDAWGTLVIENGEVYGYDNESGYYKDLFPGNFSEFHNAYNRLWNMENEKTVSKKEKKGLIYLETVSEEADKVEMFAGSFGYSKDDVSKIACNYVIEAKTNEILEYQAYVVVKEEKKLCASMKLERGIDKQTPDQKITDYFSVTDTWTQTVITDGGTDKEKAYTVTAPKGCRISVYLGFDDFVEGRFSDPECTVEAPAPTYTEDHTFYLKRAK